MLYNIVGHRKIDATIPTESGYYETKTEDKGRLITTKGWQLIVKWDSGKNSYIDI